MFRNLNRDRLFYGLALSWPGWRYKHGRHIMRLLRTVAILVSVSAGVVIYGFALAWAPHIVVHSPPFEAATADAKLNALHNARLLVLSAGGAVVVSIGLLYTARNYKLAHRGQMTDRFTKALERLGSTEMYLRIGAVRALEHVMRDSPDHHSDTVEVLISFIRARTHLGAMSDGSRTQTHREEPDPDVQAALSALCHRPHRSEREPLNFTDLDLRGASFRGGDLRHSEFWNSILEGAKFSNARLSYATFTHANLNNSWFTNADIRHAHFHHADCRGADFCDTKARAAGFTGALLDRASFKESDLRGADFMLAEMTDAKLDGADLRRAFLADEPTEYPDGEYDAIGLTNQQLQQTRLESRTKTFLSAWIARVRK
ncbi:Non-specific serine/threonine protein kinase [Micromonospora saelicesensis]|uniref:Non-specific serine/threonine protein kinase n=1 Tax=Micromonospora saelicesensis TaxID=285676 RepID=A0ABX9CC41_9ACTN|nr:pentapeptide repeat-containing protein [Micromonospora saelicesensis]RAN93856.1 Non-specific serine/threonine protein kinase [Micromonospora saelicesensis]